MKTPIKNAVSKTDAKPKFIFLSKTHCAVTTVKY